MNDQQLSAEDIALFQRIAQRREEFFQQWKEEHQKKYYDRHYLVYVPCPLVNKFLANGFQKSTAMYPLPGMTLLDFVTKSPKKRYQLEDMIQRIQLCYFFIPPQHFQDTTWNSPRPKRSQQIKIQYLDKILNSYSFFF